MWYKFWKNKEENKLLEEKSIMNIFFMKSIQTYTFID